MKKKGKSQKFEEERNDGQIRLKKEKGREVRRREEIGDYASRKKNHSNRKQKVTGQEVEI